MSDETLSPEDIRLIIERELEAQQKGTYGPLSTAIQVGQMEDGTPYQKSANSARNVIGRLFGRRYP